MKTIQFNPLKYPVYVMAKSIGAACNLRCNYCYYLDKEKLRPKSSSPGMSDVILELFTQQYIQAQPCQEVLFTWHGGEPLLMGIDYYRKALRFQQKYGQNRQIDNSLQTNGTLLTDDWCRFFNENNFLIGLSLDGPEHCHNRYRKDKYGKGSFNEVMKAVELLQKHGVEFNILSVVNDYNVKFPLEIYHFFKSIGVKYIQFSPVVERLDSTSGLLTSAPETSGALTPWSVPALEYGEFLCGIFDEWVLNDVGSVYVTTFDATLAGYVQVNPGVCVYAPTCGHAAALEANGDLYACDHFVFPEYKLGNISQRTITGMMLSDDQMRFGNDKRNRLPGSCLNCQFLSLCNGECPKNRIIETDDITKPLNYLCEGLKLYFSYTEPFMKFMANELASERPPANIMYSLRNNRK